MSKNNLFKFALFFLFTCITFNVFANYMDPYHVLQRLKNDHPVMLKAGIVPETGTACYVKITHDNNVRMARFDFVLSILNSEQQIKSNFHFTTRMGCPLVKIAEENYFQVMNAMGTTGHPCFCRAGRLKPATQDGLDYVISTEGKLINTLDNLGNIVDSCFITNSSLISTQL